MSTTKLKQYLEYYKHKLEKCLSDENNDTVEAIIQKLSKVEAAPDLLLNTGVYKVVRGISKSESVLSGKALPLYNKWKLLILEYQNEGKKICPPQNNIPVANLPNGLPGNRVNDVTSVLKSEKNLNEIQKNNVHAIENDVSNGPRLDMSVVGEFTPLLDLKPILNDYKPLLNKSKPNDSKPSLSNFKQSPAEAKILSNISKSQPNDIKPSPNESKFFSNDFKKLSNNFKQAINDAKPALDNCKSTSEVKEMLNDLKPAFNVLNNLKSGVNDFKPTLSDFVPPSGEFKTLNDFKLLLSDTKPTLPDITSKLNDFKRTLDDFKSLMQNCNSNDSTDLKKGDDYWLNDYNAQLYNSKSTASPYNLNSQNSSDLLSIANTSSPAKILIPEPYAIEMREGMFRVVKSNEDLPPDILRIRKSLYSDSEESPTKEQSDTKKKSPKKSDSSSKHHKVRSSDKKFVKEKSKTYSPDKAKKNLKSKYDSPVKSTKIKSNSPSNKSSSKSNSSSHKSMSKSSPPSSKTLTKSNSPLNKTQSRQSSPSNTTLTTPSSPLNKVPSKSSSPLSKIPSKSSSPLSKNLGKSNSPLSKDVIRSRSPLEKSAIEKSKYTEGDKKVKEKSKYPNPERNISPLVTTNKEAPAVTAGALNPVPCDIKKEHGQKSCDKNVVNKASPDVNENFIASKKSRTSVYSGKRNLPDVPTLKNLCIHVLKRNINSIKSTMSVPYEQLRPVLKCISATQLKKVEENNKYLLKDTEELWKVFCQKKYHQTPEPHETWRKLYWKLRTEQERKLKHLAASISTLSKANPDKQSKVRVIDSPEYQKSKRIKLANPGSPHLPNKLSSKHSTPKISKDVNSSSHTAASSNKHSSKESSTKTKESSTKTKESSTKTKESSTKTLSKESPSLSHKSHKESPSLGHKSHKESTSVKKSIKKTNCAPLMSKVKKTVELLAKHKK